MTALWIALGVAGVLFVIWLPLHIRLMRTRRRRARALRYINDAFLQGDWRSIDRLSDT